MLVEHIIILFISVILVGYAESSNKLPARTNHWTSIYRQTRQLSATQKLIQKHIVDFRVELDAGKEQSRINKAALDEQAKLLKQQSALISELTKNNTRLEEDKSGNVAEIVQLKNVNKDLISSQDSLVELVYKITRFMFSRVEDNANVDFLEQSYKLGRIAASLKLEVLESGVKRLHGFNETGTRSTPTPAVSNEATTQIANTLSSTSKILKNDSSLIRVFNELFPSKNNFNKPASGSDIDSFVDVIYSIEQNITTLNNEFQAIKVQLTQKLANHTNRINALDNIALASDTFIMYQHRLKIPGYSQVSSEFIVSNTGKGLLKRFTGLHNYEFPIYKPYRDNYCITCGSDNKAVAYQNNGGYITMSKGDGTHSNCNQQITFTSTRICVHPNNSSLKDSSGRCEVDLTQLEIVPSNKSYGSDCSNTSRRMHAIFIKSAFYRNWVSGGKL